MDDEDIVPGEDRRAYTRLDPPFRPRIDLLAPQSRATTTTAAPEAEILGMQVSLCNNDR